MKKTYTKKQITEAIAYWKNKLKMMNESNLVGVDAKITFSAERPDVVEMLTFTDEWDNDIGSTVELDALMLQYKKTIEKFLENDGIKAKVVSMEGPVHYGNEWNVGFKTSDKEGLLNALNNGF